MRNITLFVATMAMALTPAPLAATDNGEADMSGSEERLSEAPDKALVRAMSDLGIKTQVALDTWWQDGEDWSVDLERGIIEFRNERGWVVSAPVQVIGTYDTLDGTFMWGWDHPSVPAASASAAKLVREYGSRHGLEVLTTRLVEISEDEAWEFTALADYLSEGNGAYRGPTGTTLVFMTYGRLTISMP